MSFYFVEAKSKQENEWCLKGPGASSLSRLIVPITTNFEFAPVRVREGSSECCV